MDEQKQKNREQIAARLRQLRCMRAYSQEMLALRAGLSTTYVGQIERGLKCPTIGTLCRIADALDVPAAALLPSGDTTDGERRLCSVLDSVPEEQRELVLQILEDVTRLL